MNWDIITVYSSQTKRFGIKEWRRLKDAIESATEICIVVRQNPQGNILPCFIGEKGSIRTGPYETEKGFCCYNCSPKKMKAETFVRLIRINISNIHWVDVYS